MGTAHVISILAICVTILIAVAGAGWKISRTISTEVNARFDTAQKDSEDRIVRVYSRLDTVKIKAEETFTRKDVCAVMHEALGNTLRDYSARVDTGFKELNRKVDQLISDNNGKRG